LTSSIDPKIPHHYRPDIDGLRAIAVLCVLGFHAFPEWLPGGFIGVDIFFVISGFLITGIIFKQSKNDTFSFVDFYARRARRILPALIAVLIVCLALGWILFLPLDFAALAKQVGAAAGFVSNFVLLHNHGYFDRSAELTPLLHLWSLAVEEQFYILWPLLLIAVQRRKGSPLQAARVVCFLSFVFNAVLITLDRTATFYSPLTRFWELMFGSIMAIELLAGPQDTLSALARYRLGMSEQTLRHVVSVLGAILVVIGLAVIDSNRRLPGYWALIPTMAAVYLICAGPTALLNRRLLSLPALVHIGLISYPLYLWHWPLLSFSHFISSGEPDWTVKGACIALSFLLAECTYQTLEKPIRSGGWRGRKTAVAVGSLVAIGAVGLAIFALDGLPSRFNAALQNVIRDHGPPALAAYKQHGCFLGDGDGVLSFSQRCEGAAEGGTRTVLVWGDSHAAHLLPGINHALPKGLRLAEYTTAGCPPLQAYVSFRKNCAAINEFVMSKIEQLKPDTVILAGFWHAYYAAGDQNVITSRIHDVIVRLKAMGVNHVVGVGQFPIWLIPPANTLRHIYDGTLVGTVDARRNMALQNRAAPLIDKSVGDAFIKAGASFVSPIASVCDAEGCMLAVPSSGGIPMMWDTDHLTVEGSYFFVEANRHSLLDHP